MASSNHLLVEATWSHEVVRDLLRTQQTLAQTLNRILTASNGFPRRIPRLLVCVTDTFVDLTCLVVTDFRDTFPSMKKLIDHVPAGIERSCCGIVPILIVIH
jgi:hypothetical protein